MNRHLIQFALVAISTAVALLAAHCSSGGGTVTSNGGTASGDAGLVDTGIDGSVCCVPSCEKECGDDGCGGSCGHCLGCGGKIDDSLCMGPPGHACFDLGCCPSCVGQLCGGPDGCGGLCEGPCPIITERCVKDFTSSLICVPEATDAGVDGGVDAGQDADVEDTGTTTDAGSPDVGNDCDGGGFWGDVEIVTRVEGNHQCLGFTAEADKGVVQYGSSVNFAVTITNICSTQLHISSPDLPPVSMCITTHGTTCEYLEEVGAKQCRFSVQVPVARPQLVFDKDLPPAGSYTENLFWGVPSNSPSTPPEGVYDVFTFSPGFMGNDGLIGRVRFAPPLVLRVVAE